MKACQFRYSLPLLALILLFLNHPVDAALVAEWRMDENGWDGSNLQVVDASGSGNHGEARPSGFIFPSYPQTVPAKVCLGGEFSPGFFGSTEHVRVTDDNSLSPLSASGGEMTLAGWFNSRNNGTLIHKGSDPTASQEYRVFISGGELALQLWGQGGDRLFTINTGLSPNTWYFFAFTVARRGNSDNFSVQGYLFDENSPAVIGSVSTNNTTLNNYNAKSFDADLLLAARQSSGFFGVANGFDGLLDETRIYNEALNLTAIQDVRADMRGCGGGPDHIRLLHDGEGLTCSPDIITIQACANSNCSALFPDPVTVHFNAPSGWNPNPVSFTGSTVATLQHTTPETVVLAAEAAPPLADNPTRCFNGSTETCQMTFADAGFVLDIPDHIAATDQAGTIAAVRKDDDSQQCVPGFSDETKTVRFHSDYENPVSGTLPVAINSNAIADGSPGTPLDLDFDTDGEAPFNLRYPDSGQIRLNAHHEGSGEQAGLAMTGSTLFIARPDHFVLAVPGNPTAADADGNAFVAAGENFDINLSARNADGEITPNFGQEIEPATVLLDSALVAPPGGANPAPVGNFGSFGFDCDGNPTAAGTACGRLNWPEVGIITLTPRISGDNYLAGPGVTGETSDTIGRFIPHHFSLSSGNITNRTALACNPVSEFSYIGETFAADFVLEARSGGNEITTNYASGFAKLGSAGLVMGAVNDGTDLTPDLVTDSAAINWIAGSGEAQVLLHLARSSPAGPYTTFALGTDPVDEDGVMLGFHDLDIAGDGTHDHGLIDQTELRFGRLVLDSAIGSELGPVALPLNGQYWNGSTWVSNDDDQCTAIALADHLQLTTNSGDSGDGSETVSLGGGSTGIIESDPVSLSNGRASLTFSTPGVPGWVDVQMLLAMDYPYLRDDLNDDGGYHQSPSARATFGLFGGNSRRIYLQEIPPQ